VRKWIGVAAAVGAWLICAVGFAQETRITIGLAGSDRLQADLKSLIDKSPQRLHKQWKTLKEILDSFVQGADLTKPVRLDLSFSPKELTYVAGVPYLKWAGREGLEENIKAFGFKLSLPDAGGIYTVEQSRAGARGSKTKKPAAGPPPKPFYLRLAFNQAIIASDKALIPANISDPSLPLKTLLPGETDAVADLQNDAKSMEAKRKNFQEFRKQLEAGIEFKRGEAQADFDLRKLALQQNLNEAERFLIESERLNLRWTTDIPGSQGLGELLLTGLAGTDLAESIGLLVNKPSYFANVKLAPQPVLQARVNFAIDPLRSGHAADLYDKLLPVMQGAMDTRPNLNAAGKTAAKEALGKLFVMLKDAIPLQVLDAHVDVHRSADGKHAGVVGIRAVDGTQATEILQLFPKIREGWKVEAGVTEHQGVTLHAITVAPHRQEEFRSVFGGEPLVYVGVSKDAVWGAAGQGSLDKLKLAIDAASQPPPAEVAPEFLSLEMHFGPWVRLLDVLRAKEPPLKSTDKTEIEQEKQRSRIRQYALDTFGTEGVMKGWLRRDGTEVKGRFEIDGAVLRFLGTVIADFTEKSLN